jgi:hypothetical protein
MNNFYYLSGFTSRPTDQLTISVGSSTVAKSGNETFIAFVVNSTIGVNRIGMSYVARVKSSVACTSA